MIGLTSLVYGEILTIKETKKLQTDASQNLKRQEKIS
jgi:hypothetical protein